LVFARQPVQRFQVIRGRGQNHLGSQRDQFRGVEPCKVGLVTAPSKLDANVLPVNPS
jgi:hypothetical protein